MVNLGSVNSSGDILRVKCREMRFQTNVKSAATVSTTKLDMIEMHSAASSVNNLTVRKMLITERGSHVSAGERGACSE
jgi:hypothetical protein